MSLNFHVQTCFFLAFQILGRGNPWAAPLKTRLTQNMLYVLSIFLVPAIDYDVLNPFGDDISLSVRVSDGSSAVRLPLSVRIQPVNEFDPVLNAGIVAGLAVTLAEDTPVGTVLTGVSATDADRGDVVTYGLDLTGRPDMGSNLKNQKLVRMKASL